MRGRQAGGVRAPRRAGSLVSVSAMPSSLRPLCSAWAHARLRGACDHSPPTALEGGNAGRRSMEGGMLTGPTPVRGRDRMLCMHIIGGMWVLGGWTCGSAWEPPRFSCRRRPCHTKMFSQTDGGGGPAAQRLARWRTRRSREELPPCEVTNLSIERSPRGRRDLDLWCPNHHGKLVSEVGHVVEDV